MASPGKVLDHYPIQTPLHLFQNYLNRHCSKPRKDFSPKTGLTLNGDEDYLVTERILEGEARSDFPLRIPRVGRSEEEDLSLSSSHFLPGRQHNPQLSSHSPQPTHDTSSQIDEFSNQGPADLSQSKHIQG